ncbi:MAG: hypothetical protein KDA75_22500, partial [Planctomycetaceae bacterium]|nr:hypothetical protein [Planctomycetaceae bacterium]
MRTQSPPREGFAGFEAVDPSILHAFVRMLFSSYEFLLLFLPLTLAGFALCRARSSFAGQVWLLAASTVFYGFWNPAYLGLLAGSIVCNYALGRRLQNLSPDSS